MEAITEGVQPIRELVLHYKDLTIEEETVQVEVDGRQVEIQGFGSDLDREFFTIYLVAPLSSGEVVKVVLQYHALLKDDIMVGLYRSSYFDTLTNTTRFKREHSQYGIHKPPSYV